MGSPLFQVCVGVVVELCGFLLSVSALCCRQQDSEGHQDRFQNFFLGQYEPPRFLSDTWRIYC